MIRVVSKRKGGTEAEDGEYVIDVCRPHPLGNPYTFRHGDRDTICDLYESWLHDVYSLGLKCATGPKVFNAINNIAARHKAGERIALRCWCAPKRCHAESIKRLAEAVARNMK